MTVFIGKTLLLQYPKPKTGSHTKGVSCLYIKYQPKNDQKQMKSDKNSYFSPKKNILIDTPTVLAGTKNGHLEGI